MVNPQVKIFVISSYDTVFFNCDSNIEYNV